jgi:hypothetical protein
MFKILILCLFSFVYSQQQILSPIRFETVTYKVMRPLSSYNNDSKENAWKTPFLIGAGIVFVGFLAAASYTSYEASKLQSEKQDLQNEYLNLKQGAYFESAKFKIRQKEVELQNKETVSYGLLGGGVLTGLAGGYVIYAF